MKCGFGSCQEVAVDVFFEKVAGDTLSKKKNLYFQFVGLEEGLDRMPRNVVW